MQSHAGIHFLAKDFVFLLQFSCRLNVVAYPFGSQYVGHTSVLVRALSHLKRGLAVIPSLWRFSPDAVRAGTFVTWSHVCSFSAAFFRAVPVAFGLPSVCPVRLHRRVCYVY